MTKARLDEMKEFAKRIDDRSISVEDMPLLEQYTKDLDDLGARAHKHDLEAQHAIEYILGMERGAIAKSLGSI